MDVFDGMVGGKSHWSSFARRSACWCLCLGVWSIAAAAVKRDLLQLTPAQFAQRPEVGAPIALANFDRELLAAAIFHETNRWRAQLGLPLLSHRRELDRAADVQVAFGSLMTEVGHTNPLPSQATPTDRVIAAGLNPKLVGENVVLTPLLDADNQTLIHTLGEGTGLKYFNPDTGRELHPHTYESFATRVLAQWMESPSHRANIVNAEFRSLGCGVRPRRSVSGTYSLYAVQVFYTPAPLRR